MAAQTLRKKRLKDIRALKTRQKLTLRQGFNVQVVYLRGDPKTLEENWGDRKRKEVNKEIILENWYELCSPGDNCGLSCRTLEDSVERVPRVSPGSWVSTTNSWQI